MIRINLLGGEKQKVKKAAAFDPGRQITLICSLILVLAAAGIGWWYWTLEQQSQQLDTDIAAAEQEAARLRTLLTEVTQFEARRAQLQQRVTLIEQLRSGQSLPVQLLDHISRSVPETLWLTQLEQAGTEVTIEGRSTTQVALADFVSNLGNGSLLVRPIEIVNSQTETAQAAAPGQPAPELIRFSVKAQVAGPPKAAAAAPAGAAPAAPAAAPPATN